NRLTFPQPEGVEAAGTAEVGGRLPHRERVHRALHLDLHPADWIDGCLRCRDRVAAPVRVTLGGDLGERRQGNLLLGAATRAVRRAPNPFQSVDTSALKHAENRGGTATAGDQADVEDVIATE